MVKAKILLKPRVAVHANLRQCVEWIVFNDPPLTGEYDAAFRFPGRIEPHFEDPLVEKIHSAKQNLFIALREGHLPAKSNWIAEAEWDYDSESFSKWKEGTMRHEAIDIPIIAWSFSNIDWNKSSLVHFKSDEAFDQWLRGNIFVETARLFEIFPGPEF